MLACSDIFHNFVYIADLAQVLIFNDTLHACYWHEKMYEKSTQWDTDGGWSQTYQVSDRCLHHGASAEPWLGY